MAGLQCCVIGLIETAGATGTLDELRQPQDALALSSALNRLPESYSG